MIPPDPSTDDLQGATVVIDTDVLIDAISFHSVIETWCGGAPIDPAALARRCTRARDGLLLGIALHATKARSYSLRDQPLKVMERVAPRDVNGLATAFVRATNLYVKPVVLCDWLIVIPDGGGAPEPDGTPADHELARVAEVYGLPLLTMDGRLRKHATKRGVQVLSPLDYVNGTALDMNAELEAFVQRYVAGIPAFARLNPRPDRVESFLRQLVETLYPGVFARAA